MKKKKAAKRTGAARPSHSDALTRAKQIAFLDAIAEVGNITAAAELSKISRDSHYEWLSPQRDPQGKYQEEFDRAFDRYRDRIRSMVLESAQGLKVPVFYQGKQVTDMLGQPAYTIVRSDRLLERLAEANCPEFRQKQEVAGNHTHMHYDAGELVNLSDDELKRLDEITRKVAVSRGNPGGAPETGTE